MGKERLVDGSIFVYLLFWAEFKGKATLSEGLILSVFHDS